MSVLHKKIKEYAAKADIKIVGAKEIKTNLNLEKSDPVSCDIKTNKLGDDSLEIYNIAYCIR